jgi:hypothetical protein
MSTPKEQLAGACGTVMDFIEFLKAKGVRQYKGDILAPDGSRVWTGEMTFDREQAPRRGRTTEE